MTSLKLFDDRADSLKVDISERIKKVQNVKSSFCNLRVQDMILVSESWW